MKTQELSSFNIYTWKDKNKWLKDKDIFVLKL